MRTQSADPIRRASLYPPLPLSLPSLTLTLPRTLTLALPCTLTLVLTIALTSPEGIRGMGGWAVRRLPCLYFHNGFPHLGHREAAMWAPRDEIQGVR